MSRLRRFLVELYENPTVRVTAVGFFITSGGLFTFFDNSKQLTVWLLGKMLASPSPLTDVGVFLSTGAWAAFGVTVTAVAGVITSRKNASDDEYASAGPVRRDARVLYKREIEHGSQYRVRKLERELIISKKYHAKVIERFTIEAEGAPAQEFVRNSAAPMCPWPKERRSSSRRRYLVTRSCF